MRFEIRAGGALAILTGLGLLSGSVFLLGLVAGYEMGQQQESNRQFASVFSLPPALPPAPVAAPAPDAPRPEAAEPVASVVPGPSIAPQAAATPGASQPIAPVARASVNPVSATTPSVASAPEKWLPMEPAAGSSPSGSWVPIAPAVSVPAVVEPASASSAAVSMAPHGTGEAAASSRTGLVDTPEVGPSTKGSRVRQFERSSAKPSADLARNEADLGGRRASGRRKGFNLQIEAVMDRTGANTMVAKLRRQGYNAYMVQTAIAGQTWYRVRVGPFATQQQARAAESKLHDQYTPTSAAR